MQVLAGPWASVLLMRAVDWQCQRASPPPSRRGNPCPSGVLYACLFCVVADRPAVCVGCIFEGLTWAGLLVGMFLKYGPQSTELVVWVFRAPAWRGVPVLCRGQHDCRIAAALALVGMGREPAGGVAAAGDGAAGDVVPASRLAGPAATCCALTRCALGARDTWQHVCRRRWPIGSRSRCFLRPVARTSAPIEHTKRMERALKDAGVPVDRCTPQRGNRFYTEPHRCEYDTRLLTFLSQQ